MVFVVLIEAFVPLGSVPPPLVWGRGLRARIARTRRYWQIVGIALRHGLGPFLRDTRRRGLDAPARRTELGRALTQTLNAGGVTFVKLGQLLSTRPDLLPTEVVDELSRLQDRADPVPWADVQSVLESELGAPVDEVFGSIDRTPLAAASVGQVHSARLRSGAHVVVKVQRPGIRPVVERDLDIAQRLAQRLQEGTAWGRALGVRVLADGLSAAIREELDYRIEAENIRTIAATVGSRAGVGVPAIHAEVCTERVLVMERLHGTAINVVAREPGPDRLSLARSLLDCLLRQILLDGTFHADPHRPMCWSSTTAAWACWTSAPSAGSMQACATPCSGCSLPSTGVTRSARPTPFWSWCHARTPSTSSGWNATSAASSPDTSAAPPRPAFECSASCSGSSRITACRSRRSWLPCSGPSGPSRARSNACRPASTSSPRHGRSPEPTSPSSSARTWSGRRSGMSSSPCCRFSDGCHDGWNASPTPSSTAGSG